MAAKATRKRVRRQGLSEPPMGLDEVSQLPNIPDRGNPPAELRNLANFHQLTFRRNVQDRVPDLELRPLTEDDSGRTTGYQLISPEEFTWGLNVREMSRAELPQEGSSVADELAAFTPEWSGIDFMPRMARPPGRQLLRRRNGTVVIPEYVFAPEDRWVYYPSGYPWRCIGRIFVWQIASAPSWSWSGSAALVWKNAILTCSHVVPWGLDGLWKALFVPAYYDGSSIYGSGGASWVTSAHGYADHDQGDDMAVMRLAQPLGDWLGYFGYKTYNDDWEDGPYWTLAGYPGMIAGAQRPSIQIGFPITDDDSDGAGVELEYKADSSNGNSGGPLFGWWDGKPYVIGTHSGGEDNFGEDKQNVAAGGSALSSLIKWARDHW